MLHAVRPFVSEQHALITLPGDPGGYGTAVDGLEGFARTFLLAAFRLAGDGGPDPADLDGQLADYATWYADGVAAGVDPSSPERWVRPDEHGQAKVEAASIALALDLTRPWIWDRFDDEVRAQVIDYLSSVVGDESYPQTNWVWFRIVVETFLRSVGGPWSASEIASDLATHDSFYQGNGWFADGDERSFDHYGGWALHMYPILWARMTGARDLAEERGNIDAARLERFLHDYLRLIGADGSPLIQGRSLTYRFAAAAPLWAGAIAGVDVDPGLLRRAASAIVSHFVDHGALDGRGLLTLGWHHHWPRLAQAYSGPGSPYWASKGLLGLLLPADHAVWTAPERPLPNESDDHLWVAREAGWLVSSTRDDGIVRVINHGTDHATPGANVADSPLYARFGYSTATAPLLSDRAWTDPVDQSVSLIDEAGNATHRTGMTVLRIDMSGDADAAVGASVARAHWVDVHDGQRDHGSGRSGIVRDAGLIITVSMVRGPLEVRCFRVDPLPDAPDAVAVATRIRLGGWPLADDSRERWHESVAVTSGQADGVPAALVSAERGTSSVHSISGFDAAGVHEESHASPLAAWTVTPWLAGPVQPGRWCAAVLCLAGTGSAGHREFEGDRDSAGTSRPEVTFEPRGGVARRVVVRWQDGGVTHVDLPNAGDNAELRG
jgi:hypothetical protein